MLRRTVPVAAMTCMLSLHAFAGDTPRIDQQALLERMDKQDASLVVIDVRTPQEFAAGHVPGAINVPYTYLPASISTIKGAADKDIVLYCESGVRAERAASRFKEHGFTRLLHLDGDMKVWRANERPME